MMHTIKLPLSNFKDGARDGFVLSALSCEGLMSVNVLADNGYTTIFHDKGISVHDNDSFPFTVQQPAMLQGWRIEQGLWVVPLTNNKLEPSKHLDLVTNINKIPSLIPVPITPLPSLKLLPTEARHIAHCAKVIV